MSRRFRTPAALILVLACAGALAGCGVKGPLEPPPKAAGAGAPQAAASAASPAAAASSDAGSDSTWGTNQANMLAETGTAASPLSASPAPPVITQGATAAAATGMPTGSASGSGSGTKSHAGSTSTAPTSLDKIQRPNTPFILDGLL